MNDDLTEAKRQRLVQGMDPVPFEKADRDVVVRTFVEPFAKEHPKLRDMALSWCEMIVARMSQDSVDGDELWVCRSRHIGPLAGHEGLGMVRDREVVKYERVITY